MLRARVGEGMGQGKRTGALVKGIEEIPHKCARNESSQIGNYVYDATSKWDLHSFTVRQHSVIVLSIESGGMKSQDTVSVSKEIWDYVLFRKITITAEYVPGVMKLEADLES